MKKIIASLLFILFPQCSIAALPPKYQNEKDLDVMIRFVKEHQQVMSTLKSIDFKKFMVYFGDDCKASFRRERTPKPEGWVGPADPLVFKSSTCSLND